jgi:hypothetical protein
MFINDNTSASNKLVRWLHHQPEASEVVDLLQQDAQVWERLLFTSGGLLKLRKCLYYIMQWDFDSEGRASLHPVTDIPTLLLTNGTNMTPKPVLQHDCSKAHKYLGLWNSPTMSMQANRKGLAVKAKNYSHRLFKSGLSKYEVSLAYFSCFVPAMVFTFTVCSFTMAELTTLQKAPVRATLARLGFNWNISRDIVFGSTMYGGLGLLHLFVEQGIAQLQLLLRHLRAETPQGPLMLIGLSWWHLVVGFSSSLWENTQANICYVEHSWYSSLKDFLSYANGSVYIPHGDFLHWSPLREHDVALMECISSLEGVSKACSNGSMASSWYKPGCIGTGKQRSLAAPRNVDAPPKPSYTSYTAPPSITRLCLIPCTMTSRPSSPVTRLIPTSVVYCSRWWTHAGENQVPSLSRLSTKSYSDSNTNCTPTLSFLGVSPKTGSPYSKLTYASITFREESSKLLPGSIPFFSTCLTSSTLSG